MGSRVLLLGGRGYIGSRLACYLPEQGFDVESVDLEWFGNFVAGPNLAQDVAQLSAAYVRSFDHVILLAGHSSVLMSSDRQATHRNNVTNFIDLLGKVSPDQTFIYASSSSIYGNSGAHAAHESDPFAKPISYYDLSKFEIDCYATLSALRYVGLRFGTVCGPSPNLRTDVMINKMVASATTSNSVTVYNAAVHRPILGLEDLCRAVREILRRSLAPGIYNLASFNETIGAIASKVARQLGAEVRDLGATPTYDFCVDTRRFREAYDFEFRETVPTIVTALANSKALNGSARGVRSYV